MTPSDLAASLGDAAPERAVARDVEAELAAHLELAAEALEAEGHASDQAHALARERFGDLDRIRRDCLRIRLGRIHAMKKLLVASNLVLLALLVGAVLVARQRHERTQAALQEAMASRALAEELAQHGRGPAPAPVEHIVVEVGDSVQTFDQHRNVDFSERAEVQLDGQVLLHDVGWVDVVGLTREQVEQRLTEAYAPYYQDLTVNVIVHKRPRRIATPQSRELGEL